MSISLKTQKFAYVTNVDSLTDEKLNVGDTLPIFEFSQDGEDFGLLYYDYDKGRGEVLSINPQYIETFRFIHGLEKRKRVFSLNVENVSLRFYRTDKGNDIQVYIDGSFSSEATNNLLENYFDHKLVDDATTCPITKLASPITWAVRDGFFTSYLLEVSDLMREQIEVEYRQLMLKHSLSVDLGMSQSLAHNFVLGKLKDKYKAVEFPHLFRKRLNGIGKRVWN